MEFFEIDYDNVGARSGATSVPEIRTYCEANGVRLGEWTPSADDGIRWALMLNEGAGPLPLGQSGGYGSIRAPMCADLLALLGRKYADATGARALAAILEQAGDDVFWFA